MIKLLQIKPVLRNKNFIFFTILIPSFWLISLDMMLFHTGTHDYFGSKISYKYIIFATCCLTGIAGNSLVTFSKRINTSREYYLLQFKISHYSVWNWLTDSLLTQLILNLMISIILFIVGIFLHVTTFNWTILMLMLLINIVGIYLSLIGFALGILVDGKTLDASGFPIMILMAFLLIPFNHFTTGSFVDWITLAQKVFPGYYTYNILSHLSDTIAVNNGDVMAFFVSMVLTALPFLIILALKLPNNRNMMKTGDSDD
ncbi:lantibiotic ABC transporter permease (plasmid) [Nicoliella spurrieriana]|uniref:Lantibiotic ABC transporter permease n=1 Tax=Nicoliella spurrieriana TaxID=2925830 RepID=A0A976X568_9LACO|nr:lantibiotic ABC transporter permease [Nicoliella spurrieriana]UQS86222.1 lantibiotic ABC transporter permease [Nicoliella spurrieriana]